jgi:hypothetical protein
LGCEEEGADLEGVEAAVAPAEHVVLPADEPLPRGALRRKGASKGAILIDRGGGRTWRTHRLER